LASLKKLAGQTVWYGVSNIAARMIGALLTPIVTYLLNTPSGVEHFGENSMLMAAIPFINVIFTYGLETGYFRFSINNPDRRNLFQTTFTSLLISTTVFSVILISLRHPIASFLKLDGHSEYITWCVYILALDTLSAIPFAHLRQEERPRKYAFVRVAGITVNIVLTLFFLAYSPHYVAAHPSGSYAQWYNQYDATGFLLLPFIAQSAVTFLLLAREWTVYRFGFDKELWKKVIGYAAPMIIIGLGGMVNETIDRLMLPLLLPVNEVAAKTAVAIYSGNYKMAIFISLFIQAFRMSAEPFFFSQSTDKNAPATYARVMKWFVIVLCVAFLFTGLYLDIIQRLFLAPLYRSGRNVVPILLAANVCLGIYYNLSVWYKITDKMRIGTYITLIGAGITLVLNYTLIPRFGMYACAWATFAAYCSMMVISYFWGQKHFPVPYNVKKLSAYLTIMLALFFIQEGVCHLTSLLIVKFITASVLMLLFLRLVYAAEKKELKKIPMISKYIS
jgi:O-antigen/teichoic acid export membrane protein